MRFVKTFETFHLALKIAQAKKTPQPEKVERENKINSNTL